MKPRKSQSEIFEAALHHFARKGFEKTTMDSIADSLEMTKGNLYLYASGKKGLYEAAIRHALNKWRLSTARKVRNVIPADEQFSILCREAFSYLKGSEDLRKILQMDPTIYPIKTAEDRFSDINLSAMKILESTIRKGIEQKVFRPVDPEETARYLYSVYIMFIIKAYVKGDSSADSSLFTTAVDMNLSGLLAR